jgi:ABC-type sugar transport system permease subunit
VALPGKAGTAAAIVLVGTGCVVAVSLVFWEVGRSEDEERGRR